MINGTSYSKIPFFKNNDVSIVQCVREAMKTFPDDRRKAATYANMGHNSFTRISSLIRKLDSDKTTQENKNDIREALRIIDHERCLPRSIRGLFNKGKLSKRDLHQDSVVTAKHQKRFIRTMIAISEICETTVEMELPNLSEEEARATLRTLRRSRSLILHLMSRLSKEEQHDD